MIIKEITGETAMDYCDLVPNEYLSNLDRQYYNGLVKEDESTEDVRALIIWELKNVEAENLPTEAEILWFYADETEDGDEILSEFENNIRNEGVQRVCLEMREAGPVEKDSLSNAGYTMEEAESMDLTFSIEDLKSLRLLKKDAPEYIIPLCEISPREYKQGIMACVFNGRYGLLDDLPFLSMTRFELDISCCVFLDDKVQGFLLVHETTESTLIPELFFALEPDANLHLLQMLHFSVQAVIEYKDAEAKVIVKRHNDATKKLSERLFPGKKGDTVICCEKSL